MGDRILRALALVALASGVAHAAPAGRVVGKVTVTEADGKSTVADVIVYVVGFPEKGSDAAPAATITQKGRTFMPDLVAITVGESVAFPNGDPFLHNVFSQSSDFSQRSGSRAYGCSRGDRQEAHDEETIRRRRSAARRTGARRGAARRGVTQLNESDGCAV